MSETTLSAAIEPNSPLPTLSEETKEEAARVIAGNLRRVAEGDHFTRATWEAVAQKRGCRVSFFHLPAAGQGEYGPANAERAAVIFINTAYTEREQCAALVHELGHHELHIWLPPQLNECADTYCYRGDPQDIRHQIARIVEALVLG